jgi:hypothetical protein
LPIVIASRFARYSGVHESLLWSLAVSVGNNPDAIPSVVSPCGTSWNNKRPRGVAETFQVSEHFVEAQADVTSNVLAKDPSGSRECNNSTQLRPEVAVILMRSASSGDTEGLTGVSAADEIDSSKPTQSVCCNRPDVSEVRNAWPTFGEHGTAVRIDFAEGDRSHPGSFKPEGEAANAAEGIENIHAALIDSRPTVRGFGAASSAITCISPLAVSDSRRYVAGHSVFTGRCMRV